MTGKIARAAQADLILFSTELFRSPRRHNEPSSIFEDIDIASCLNASELPEREILGRVFTELRASWHALSRDDWSAEFHRLFEGALACPLNEAAYIRRDKGNILGDICGFYRAFGWQPTPISGERPDHLTFQLEFIAMLLALDATTSHDEGTQLVRSGLSSFMQNHLNDWLPVVAEQIRLTTHLEPYAWAANWLEQVWVGLVQYHKWTVEPVTAGRPDPIEEPESPYECGAPDLMQLDQSKTNAFGHGP